ncbi:MAG: sugar ABC transporter permease [Chloroflexi bacterium]|nr:sugar ABC transporter permease [Chloroflexota bacterium]
MPLNEPGRRVPASTHVDAASAPQRPVDWRSLAAQSAQPLSAPGRPDAEAATPAPRSQPAGTRQPSRARTLRRVREVSLGYVFLAPALLLLGLFQLFPIVYGMYISACDWRLGCTQIIGLGNYTRAVNDPATWRALLTTATYSLITVPVQLSIGFLIAVLLYQHIRGREIYRVVLFLPYITSTVASAAVWSYIYSPDNGLLNTFLRAIGLQPLRWLGEPTGVFALAGNALGIQVPPGLEGPALALVAVSVYSTWVFIGYDITIMLAGLGNIPSELYEAAKVDGARGWALTRYITFPLLSPTLFFLLIVTVIGTFKAFNHIWVLTQGGPVNATTTSSILIFKQMYEVNRYGYAAALSFILFTVILVLTLLQNWLAGRRVVYD